MKKTFVVLVASLSVFALFAQNLSDSLLVHYTFDGNVLDQSGNGYNGISNATLVQDQFGVPNAACEFNGVSNYVDLPNVAPLKPALPLSFSLWVNFHDLDPTKTVIVTNNYAQNNHSGVWMNTSSSGRLAINYGSALGGNTSNNRRTKVGTTPLQTNTWYHIVAIVRGATDMDLYIDCLNDGGTYSGSSSAPIAYTSDAGSIGRKDNAPPPYHFDGVIDEFRYWNRALNQSDLSETSLCDFPTSIPESTSSESVTVFPNPASGQFSVTGNTSHGTTVKLYDVSGALRLISTEVKNIDISSLQKGLYLVEVIDGISNVATRNKLLII